MKTTLIFLFGAATGWFVLLAIQSWLEAIYDWRPCAGLAIATAMCAVVVNYFMLSK